MTVPERRSVKSLDERRAPLSWPAKDPDEVVDYAIDWRDRLRCDTIASSTFSLSTAAGLVIDDQSEDNGISVVTLSAGTIGSKAKLLCRITTGNGRTFDESVSLLIKAR